MSRLHELGRQVAALQDCDLVELRAADQAGASFIRALRQQSRPKLARRPPARYLLAAALVGIAAIVIVGWAEMARWKAPQPLAVTPAIAVGDPISAPPDETIPLRFSDGSEMRLVPGTEAIVRELNPDGAHVEVTRGAAQISVRHHPKSSWSLRAGPYAVEVTGTRFDLAWSPDTERFSLDLWEGSVRVSSQGSGHSAVRMVAPERLVIDSDGWNLSRPEVGPPAAPEPSAAPVAPPSAAAAKPAASGAVVVPEAPAPPAESWEELAGRGDYQAAYEAAQAQGLGALAQSGSASQLLALAQTCRLSGHGGEGVAVLSRLRARFPGTEEAVLAAFQLGRLTGGAASAQWFQTYLDERPNGRLSREAAGRLLEALERMGDHSQAQAAAKRYLARYPKGPHAAFAARLLDD